MAAIDAGEFDLTPSPRILAMLGEIKLEEWQCLAEFIDNSVDALLKMKSEGELPHSPEVLITIPLADSPEARITVRDNGPGMTPATLEKAAKAGWSGNNALDNLGLFGMGFNIATARLGSVTTIWTTRKGDTEWVGLRIDFDELKKSGKFTTPRRTRPKLDANQHGTEIVVERLKADERRWFARAGNRSSIERNLSKVYGAMLRPNGQPITFSLKVNNKTIEGRRHCVWGESRIVQTSRFGQIEAFQPINIDLGARAWCNDCWLWLPAGEQKCEECGKASAVITRVRKITGWIGIQRYLNEDYGIDFLRHGRKIEARSRDLFYYSDGGETPELEYPIDDFGRKGGRIVGEIHLDHCRVHYTKQSFDRTDSAWDEMLRYIRGTGPLRPEKARQAGITNDNHAPLYRLYQAFRRNSVHRGKGKSVSYKRLLLVKNNDQALEYAEYFHKGEAAYQSDDKWWELVAAADEEELTSSSTASPSAASPGPQDAIPGFATNQSPQPQPVVPMETVQAPPLTGLPSLSRKYVSDLTDQYWEVRAFEAGEEHAQLTGKRPWFHKVRPTGEHEFIVNTRHEIFASTTFTVLDALLAELAWSTMDYLKDDPGDITFAAVLANLRERYATQHALDPSVLASESKQVIMQIAATLAHNIEPSDAPMLFKELSTEDQKSIQRRMATAGASGSSAIIQSGRFLEYAEPRVIRDFFSLHPELFLDGNCWDDPYAIIEFEDAAATDLARTRVVRHYENLLEDAVWLADQENLALDSVTRPRLLRAVYALDLLAPSSDGGANH